MVSVRQGSLPTYASALAGALRDARDDLVTRWLERIIARVAIDPNRVFPTDELLNHVPLLIEGIADFIERPEDALDAAQPVSAKAMELGALRHAQGFDAYEILKEHEILGAILFAFVAEVMDTLPVAGTREELFHCTQRLMRAIELIRQATMTHFLRLSAQQVNEREERLRRFNRMVSHELKNRVSAIRGAARLLDEVWIDPVQRDRFLQMILENAQGLQRVLENLEA
ncbi:MAG: histidine kinase dimerization/phospho-acceptor domain-containing protein, partial [Gemmatimonadaceae bacterium]